MNRRDFLKTAATVAALAPLVEAFPDMADEIQAFASTSNTLTNADSYNYTFVEKQVYIGKLVTAHYHQFSTYIDAFWKNYKYLIIGLGNSLLVSGLSTILTVYFSALTAYALTAYKWKLRKVCSAIIMFAMMIPSTISTYGFLQLIFQMRLTNKLFVYILPAMASPMTVFFMWYVKYLTIDLFPPYPLIDIADKCFLEIYIESVYYGGRKFIELSSHVVLIAFEDDRCEPADYLQRLYWKRREGLLVDLIGESHLELTKIHALFEHRTRAHDVLAVDHDIGITEVLELL